MTNGKDEWIKKLLRGGSLQQVAKPEWATDFVQDET